MDYPIAGEDGVRAVDRILMQDEDDSVETIAPAVPIGTALLQLGIKDDDVNKMENFMMEDPDIPLNMRFVQEHDDIVMPADEQLVHYTNEDGDELIMIRRD